MSYSIEILDHVTRETREFETPQDLSTGSTQEVGGATTASFGITYNYSPYYYELWYDGLPGFNGKKLSEVRPVLVEAIGTLGTERDRNYWAATEGNAGAALQDLLEMFDVCNENDIMMVY